jgi:hypothetical protein
VRWCAVISSRLAIRARIVTPAKRVALLERVAARLRMQGARRPSDADIESALKRCLAGLMQGASAA